MQGSDLSLAGLLLADGPATDRADQMALYGWLVGAWTMDAVVHMDDGSRHSGPGEIRFAWALAGRAIVNVWVLPGVFHGTTLRFYDARLGAWQSTWIDPVNGRVRRFVGRPAGDEILLLSDEEEPYLRWRFTDVARDNPGQLMGFQPWQVTIMTIALPGFVLAPLLFLMRHGGFRQDPARRDFRQQHAALFVRPFAVPPAR